MAALDLSGFVQPPEDFQGIYKLGETLSRNKERKQELDYRDKKDQEDQDWRKLNLIQDLTDLSKHQTGSDVANAIGNQQAAQTLQKYTALSKTMSPAELMSNIQKDMSGITSGMDAAKNELQMSDEYMKALKTLHPNLDITKLAQDHRAEILSRRLNGESFVNPLQVPGSQFKFDDPQFLSRYMTGDKNMTESISNPKGMEDSSVFVGNPNSYTKFSAKIPFWKKPNFDPATLNDGFMKGKIDPSLSIKSSTIPSDALPSSNGKPFEVIDKDVYDRFAQDKDMNLELIAATRNKYPNYDNFRPTEKEYAERNVLLDKIKTLDQNNFHPTEVHSPSASLLKFFAGDSGGNKGKGGDEANMVDVYKEVTGKFDTDAIGSPLSSGKILPLSKLSTLAQQSILKQANSIAGNTEQNPNDPNKVIRVPFHQEDIVIAKKDDKLYMINNNNQKTIAPIDFQSTNLQAQPGIKEKREVIKQSGKQSKETKPKEDLRSKYGY